MHCLKVSTEREVRSPPTWSMPHSMVKFRPREMTRVLFAAGQARSDEAAAEVDVVLVVLEVLLTVGGLSSSFE